MTLVELSVGIVITTLVIGALGALWYAVAETWRKSSSSQNVSLTGNQAAARLEAALRQSKYICQWKAGSIDGLTTPVASAFLWKGDDWNGSPDGQVQVGELALIEHDPAAQRIYLYQAKPYGSMTLDQQIRAGTVFNWSTLSSSSTPSDFKNLDYVQRTVLSEAVTGALFNVPTATTGARPVLEFSLTISRSSGTTLVYSAASLRTPSPRPL
jgi:hypothetical protein